MGVVDERPLTVAQVARTMGLTRQNVQWTADLLVEDGLATYEDNRDHKRAKLLRLSAQGQAALNVIEAKQRAWAARIEAAVGGEALAQALLTLQRLLHELEAEEGRERRVTPSPELPCRSAR